MLSFFRRVSKSKVGTWIMAGVLVAILAGFAAADISNFGSGNIGGLGGMSSSTLARAGDQEIGEREMSEQMQRHLQQVRQQNPNADYATILGDFDPLLSSMLDERALVAFGDKYGLRLSKRLIDAEIAQLPQAKGLNGQFSEQAYQQFLANQRLTDPELRQVITGALLQRLVLTPVAANARVAVGMAQPFASMLLESREGEAIAIPLDPFKAGLNPNDAQLQQFYTANRNRYMIPEQRVLRIATIDPQQVAVSASPQEITAYYNANQATYGSKETRSLSQVVVPDQATANGIAARAKGGQTLAAAAAPAGSNAAVTSLADQSRQAYSSVAGDKVAAAVFAAPSGALVGPVQSDFGWVVVKVDGVKKQGGKSLAEATPEITAKLAADKRKNAIEDIVDKIQNAVDEGSNFSEAAASAKLPVTNTPLIFANGTSKADPNYKLPANLAPVTKTGFDIAPNDPPEIVSLGADQGYAMVSPGQVVQAAPAPFGSIRQQVATDWLNDQAFQRARATATAIAAKASQGVSLADAVKQSGVTLPPVRPIAARRIQLANAQGQVPVPLRLLFTLTHGKSRMAPEPGRGFYVVKVDKIVPGNAMLQPTLIGQMQTELQQSVAEDYARQFVAAVRADVKTKRNEAAIQAMKTRLSASGG